MFLLSIVFFIIKSMNYTNVINDIHLRHQSKSKIFLRCLKILSLRQRKRFCLKRDPQVRTDADDNPRGCPK